MDEEEVRGGVAFSVALIRSEMSNIREHARDDLTVGASLARIDAHIDALLKIVGVAVATTDEEPDANRT